MAITRRQFLKRSGLVDGGHAARPEPLRQPVRAPGARATPSATATSSSSSSTAATTASTPSSPYDERRAAHRLRRRPAHRRRRHQPRRRRRSRSTADRQRSRQRARSSRSIPGFAGLKQLYDLGKVAVIQGCGYPDYSLSHEESRDHLADRRTRSAWRVRRHRLGRPLPRAGQLRRQRHPRRHASASEVAREFRQTRDQRARHHRPRRLRLSRTTTSTIGRRRRPSATPSPALYGERRRRAQPIRELHRQQRHRDAAQQRELPAAARPLRARTARPFSDAYDDVDRSTARDLREVAKVIYGVEQRRPERRRAASSSSATAATTRTPTRAAPSPTASTTACTPRSATRSRSSTTTSPTWASPTRSCVARVERVRPPHPAERQRHRPRLAGADVRDRRRGGRRRLRQPSQHRRSALDDDGNTVYTQTRRSRFRSTDFRDVYGTILKHWLNMPQARHPGERAAARRRRSGDLLDGRELRPGLPRLAVFGGQHRVRDARELETIGDRLESRRGGQERLHEAAPARSFDPKLRSTNGDAAT